MVILDVMIYIYRERFLDHSSSLTKIRNILGYIKLCKKIAQISRYCVEVMLLLWSEFIDVYDQFPIKC